jgi:metallo-beta-lactamase family protein
MVEILFHGAAGEVTGSMHMVRFNGRWVALDCGLFQGRRAEADEKNLSWPVPPKEIAAVVLSHAHTDHTGRLPMLVKAGFDGPIYCTAATRDLCALMLPDSAHIQQEDVAYLNKKRRRHGLPPVQPLYDYRDAIAAVKLMETMPYDRFFRVENGMLAMFQEAGHMLGSAGVRLEFPKRKGDTRSLFFSGDVGRRQTPILRDPSAFPPSDIVLCESTYGGRVNESAQDAQAALTEVVNRTFARGGKVIVPAFSVGRTQTIVYYLHQQMEAGRIPRLPVFVDSPLAVNATEVFRSHPECYDAEATDFQRRSGDMLGQQCCTYIRDVEESKRLHGRREPCVIISASGMCETGRIQHHIRNNISNAANTLLIPGFQAEGTLGRRLADGARKVTLFHEEREVRAEVIQLHGFSGHADQNELLGALAPLRDSTQRLFLVHAETSQSEVLAEKLRAAGFRSVTIAKRGERATL